MAEEVFPWLKSLPLAPEYHPTLNEFQDPIAYIFKIEEEASKYGICKIVPPVSGSPKKTIIANLNRSLSARNPDSSPTFTTRQQQMGFCPRKHQRPVHKSVWQSGETYTVPQFEVKAKSFEKNYAKKGSNSKKGLSALEVETLYWKAHMDKPFSIEYANDMPGSAFDPMSGGGGGGTKQGKKEIGDAMTVGETPWNMRGVSRAKGSLLKFMKEEIPGVTSPMVYISMLFSWFAWHVEDHDLHSLNYMHMGAGKTWYGVPRDAAPSFEDVIRTHGYGGEINPIVTFATLGEKTTIMSPEVLLNLGVPCCRLVQNAGEFVVTFPRAYHSGFSHGFSCGEAANIATPGWLRVARDAAIRRASINCAPMVSHFQMLYDLAISLSSRVPTSVRPEPRSSRLKDRLKAEGEGLVKRLFLEDMMQNNELLHVLAKGSPIVFFSEDALDGLASSDSCFRSQSNASPRLSLGFCTQDNESKSRGSFASDDVVPDTRPRRRKYSSFGSEHEKKPDPGFFSCVTCGVVCYACVAIVQPTEAAAQYLKSADCSGISDLIAATDFFTVNEDASVMDPNSSSEGKMPKSAPDGLFDVPIDSADQMQAVDDSMNTTSATGAQEVNSSLGLLALAYGDSSDSGEDDDVERDIHVNNSCDLSLSIDNDAGDQTEGSVRSKCNNFVMESNRSMGRFEYQIQVPHSERKLSNARESKASIGKAITPVGNRPMNPARDADTSRMHVFCLPHAVEAEQRLRLIGGAHMLILCHQEFPKLDIEASFMANELGMDYICTDLVFREIKKQDKERIQSALDIDEATHGNQDWTVKLGIDIFYSARLSQSSLYRKQMPYNSVIYNAFGHCSPSTDPTKPKPLGRQKKIIVAGKWCGKVWMSNQAHPLLVVRDVEEQELHETDVSAFSKADVKLEKQSQSTQAVVISKYVRKRKKNATTETVKVKFPKAESSSPPSADELPLHGGFRRQRRTNLRNKQMRKGTAPHPRNVVDKKAGRIGMDSEDDRDSGSNRSLRRRIIKPPSRDFEPKQKAKQQRRTKKAKKAPAVEPREIEEGEFACDVEGCNMSFDSKQDLMAHKKNVCPVEGCGKKFFSHKYLVQHRRVHMDSRPLDCPWKGCSMTFKWAWARTEHIRVHTGARPYTCKEEGCGQTFRFVSDFSRHKRKTGHSVKK